MIRDPVPAGHPASLFPTPTSRIPTGSSIVLLTAAPGVAEAPTPALFEGIAPQRPQNFAVVADFTLIDYGSIQCLVLPGDPVRMQIQWTGGATLAEAREFARRFFRLAVVPRTLGVNFGVNFEFAAPAVSQLTPYLNVGALRDVVGADVRAAGFKIRSEIPDWRVLIALEPGASATQLTWQVNFERNVVSYETIVAALDSLESLSELNTQFLGRLAWSN